MSLDKYRLPASVTDGVAITLPDTDAPFRVRLPTQLNRSWRKYVLQTLSEMGAKFDSTGDVQGVSLDPGRLAEWEEARIAAFVDLCVVAYPNGLDRDALLGDYYPAAEALFAAALELAEKEDAAAGEAAKKSATSSAGKRLGRAARTSIADLSAQGASPRRTGDRRPTA